VCFHCVMISYGLAILIISHGSVVFQYIGLLDADNNVAETKEAGETKEDSGSSSF
jgi:hypothetical protein